MSNWRVFFKYQVLIAVEQEACSIQLPQMAKILLVQPLEQMGPIAVNGMFLVLILLVWILQMAQHLVYPGNNHQWFAFGQQDHRTGFQHGIILQAQVSFQ